MIEVEIPGIGVVEFADEAQATSYFKSQKTPNKFIHQPVTDAAAVTAGGKGDFTEDLKGFGKGLAAGASLPGQAAGASFFKTPVDLVKAQSEGGIAPLKSPIEDIINTIQGERTSLSDVGGIYKKNYQDYNSRIDEMKEENPIGALFGSIPKSMVEYSLGTKLLSALPGIGASDTTSKLGKVLEFVKKANRGGMANVGIGQSGGLDGDRVSSDYIWGAGGEAGGDILAKGADFVKKTGRNIGGRLMESFLRRPRNVIRQEMARGDTLGRELYDQKVWGTQKSMANQAQEGLETGEDALQSALKGSGRQPINKKFAADELSKLKDFYSQIPGREAEVQKIESMIATVWQGKKMTASEANEVKRAIYKLRGPAYLKDMNPVQADAEKSMARGLKKGIQEIVPSAKGINKNLSTYGRLKDAMGNLEASGQKSNFAKLIPLVAGTGAGFADQNPVTGLSVALAMMGGGTPLAKSGSARTVRGISDLLQGLLRNSRYVVPAMTGANAGK